MAGRTRADDTPGTTFVSNDGLVSFDAQGYRLDSLGNRTTSGNAGIGGESKPRYQADIQADIDKWQEEIRRYEADMAAWNAAQQAGAVPGYNPQYNKPAADQVWRYDPLSGKMILDKPLSDRPLERTQQLLAASSWAPPDILRSQQAMAGAPEASAVGLDPYNVFVPQVGTVKPNYAPQSPAAPSWFMDANPTYGQQRQPWMDYRPPQPVMPRGEPTVWGSTPTMDYVRGLGLPTPNNQRFDQWR